MVDLAEVCALIEAHEGRSLGACAALEELCSRIPAESLLGLLIDSAADRPSQVAECARRSYRHALGFEKIMLMVGARASTLRLHVWRPADVPAHAAEHIHNHRFEFASAVLRGSVAMETFTPHPGGTPMTAFEESIGTDGRSWVMRPRGQERLRKTMDLRLAAGTLYQMDAEAMHRVTNDPSRRTITLFLEAASGHGRTTTDVYAPLGAGAPAEFHRVPLRVDEYMSALAEMRSALAGDSGGTR